MVKEQTFDFQRCQTWYDAALQILSAAGWRPDCAKAESISKDRTLPPECREGAGILIGSLETMEGAAKPPEISEDGMPKLDKTHVVDVEVVIFFQEPPSLSCSYTSGIDGEISSQGWVFRQDPGPVATVFAREFALLHRYLLESSWMLPGCTSIWL